MLRIVEPRVRRHLSEEEEEEAAPAPEMLSVEGDAAGMRWPRELQGGKMCFQTCTYCILCSDDSPFPYILFYTLNCRTHQLSPEITPFHRPRQKLELRQFPREKTDMNFLLDFELLQKKSSVAKV